MTEEKEPAVETSVVEDHHIGDIKYQLVKWWLLVETMCTVCMYCAQLAHDDGKGLVEGIVVLVWLTNMVDGLKPHRAMVMV